MLRDRQHWHHEYYRSWTPVTKELLLVKWEALNDHSPLAVAIRKDREVVTPVPKSLINITYCKLGFECILKRLLMVLYKSNWDANDNELPSEQVTPPTLAREVWPVRLQWGRHCIAALPLSLCLAFVTLPVGHGGAPDPPAILIVQVISIGSVMPEIRCPYCTLGAVVHIVYYCAWCNVDNWVHLGPALVPVAYFSCTVGRCFVDILVAGHHITRVRVPLLLHLVWYLGSCLHCAVVIRHCFIVCIMWDDAVMSHFDGIPFLRFPLSLYRKGDHLWFACLLLFMQPTFIMQPGLGQVTLGRTLYRTILLSSVCCCCY